jgi:rod shape-determining protein MreD
MRSVALNIGILLAIVVAYTLLADLVAIAGLTPDLPLVAVVFVALRYGQIPGTLAGFGTGLTFDLLSAGDGVMGLSALAKTVAGFLAGYFYNETKTQQLLGGYEFVVLVGAIALVHNVLYFVILLQGTEIGWGLAILRYGIPSALYTAAASLIPMFVVSRRSSLA